MNLVDVYVTEVGRHLPARNREDIEKEIRTLVEDMLDDASAAAGRAPDETMTVEVLRKLGSPEKVAASYQAPRYLVGPEYFPTFLLVMKIVATVLLVLSAIGVGVKLGTEAADPLGVLSILGMGLAEYIQSLLIALGNVVIVFAVLQWFVPHPKGSAEEWDPRKMRVEPDPERVTQSGQIFAIVGNIVLLAFLNFFTRWSLFTFTAGDGTWLTAPVLTDAFFAYLPWINLTLVAGLTLNVLLMAQGRWTNALRILSAAIHVASIVLAAVMLTGPALVGLDAAAMQQAGWSAEQISSMMRLEPLFDGAFRLALSIAIVTSVIELAKLLFKILRPRISLPAGLGN